MTQIATRDSYGATLQELPAEHPELVALDADLSGREVLIVEDVLDTGVTLSNLVPMLQLRHPNSVRICAILDKPARRKTDIRADYTGFEVPDAFVVGYGLDYDEKYRNLPFVGVLKPEVYGG